MQREDVQTVTRDWVHHWFGELKELEDIVTEQAEDDYLGKKY